MPEEGLNWALNWALTEGFISPQIQHRMFHSYHRVSCPIQVCDPSQRARRASDNDGKQWIERRTRDPESDLECPNPRTTVGTMFYLSSTFIRKGPYVRKRALRSTGPIPGREAVLQYGLDRDDQKRKQHSRLANVRSKQEPLNGEHHAALTRLGWVMMGMSEPDWLGVCDSFESDG